MRVLACYVDQNLKPDAYRALIKYVPIGSLEMVNVAGNISNYWHQFRARWRGEYDLVTVEQDNVINGEVLPSFQTCDQPWCVYEYVGPPYMEDRQLKHSLGCTRFTQQLQKEIPWQRFSERDYFSWHLIDYRIGHVLGHAGYKVHVHGEVVHLHDYSTDPNQIAKQKVIQKESIRKGLENRAQAFAASGLPDDLDDEPESNGEAPEPKAKEGASAIVPVGLPPTPPDIDDLPTIAATAINMVATRDIQEGRLKVVDNPANLDDPPKSAKAKKKK